jgi:hypothetical protein
MLLGISGIALSVASGWTTWDGMSNFTHNPVLSFLITFGIQSVMLISAWMIGESFAEQARDKNVGKPHAGDPIRPFVSDVDMEVRAGYSEAKVTFFWAVVFAVSIALLSTPTSGLISGLPLKYFIVVAAFLAGAMLLRKAFHILGYGDLVLPYERSATAIFKNAPLWVMFLICLSASVFFSFDSLFDKIYSSADRESVSQSRLQSHVSGLLSDLDEQLQKSRRTARLALLDDPGWRAFEAELDDMTDRIETARKEMEVRQIDRGTARNHQIGVEVAALSAAQAEREDIENQLARVKADLRSVEHELAGARSERQNLERVLSTQKSMADQKAQEAAMEASGNGVTQLAGKGHKYRQLKVEEAALRIDADKSKAQLPAALLLIDKLTEERKRLDETIAKFQSTRSEIISRIAFAKWQIDNPGNQDTGIVQSLDALHREMGDFMTMKAAFLNRPTRQTYAALNAQCIKVADMVRSVSERAGDGRAFQCDMMAGSGALVRIFDSNAALARFDAACGKTLKLGGLTADQYFQTGQSCIQMSGLSSAVTAEHLSALRQVALRRDDRAHRFVVTWNAFFDTNPLAFVALFIALSIDGLVFITGQFGANAEVNLRMLPGRKSSGKSPVSDMRGEAILDFSLLPDVAGTARSLLGALVPAPLERASRLAGEIDLSNMVAENADPVRTVLNTACALQMAEKLDDGERYAVKTDLIDHLSSRLGWQRGVSAGTWVETDPEQMLDVALGCERHSLTHCILQHSQPVPVETGYAYALYIPDCPEHMQAQITGVMNTAVAGGTVSGDPGGERRYLLTAAFISMITRLAASEPDREPNLDRPAAPERSSAVLSSGDNGIAAASDIGNLRRIPDLPGTNRGGTADVDGQPAGDPANTPALPVNIVPDEQPGEPAVSSKLITFPIDSKLRQQAGGGRDDRAASAAFSESQTTSSDLDKAAEDQALMSAISGFVSGTDITPQEVIDWLGTGPGPQIDDAWSFLEQLRDRDGDFHAKLNRHENAAHRKIEHFGTCLQDANWNSDTVCFSPVPDGQSDPESWIYRRYFLRHYAVKEAMDWCAKALTELETNAVIGTDSASRRSQLQLIDDVIAHLAPLDELHRHEWSEIGLRVAGLDRQHADVEAFSDLMP